MTLAPVRAGQTAVVVFMEAIEEAQSLDRHNVRERAARQFDSDRIVNSTITVVNKLVWEEESRLRQAYNHGLGKDL